MSKVPYAVPRWGYGAINNGLVQPPEGQAESGFATGQRPPAQWFNYLFNSYGSWLGFLSGPDLSNWTRRDWYASPVALSGRVRLGYDNSDPFPDQPNVFGNVDFPYAGRYVIVGTNSSSVPTVRASTTGGGWMVLDNFPVGANGAATGLAFDTHQRLWWITVDGTPGQVYRTVAFFTGDPSIPTTSAVVSGTNPWDAVSLPVGTTGVMGIALDPASTQAAIITHDRIVVSTNPSATTFVNATHPPFSGGATGCDILRTPASWIAIATNGKIYRTADLTTSWTLVTTLTLPAPTMSHPIVPQLAAGDGKVVAYLYNYDEEQSIWISEDDGLTWAATTSTLTYVTRLRYADGTWMASATSNTLLMQSNDLLAWTLQPLFYDTGEGWSLGDVVYGDGIWLATGDSWTIASGRARRPLGTTWLADGTPQYLSDAGYLRSIPISVVTPMDGQVLVYDGASKAYVPETPVVAGGLPSADHTGQVPYSHDSGLAYDPVDATIVVQQALAEYVGPTAGQMLIGNGAGGIMATSAAVSALLATTSSAAARAALGVGYSVTTHTSTYNAAGGDVLLADASGGAFTITLPTPSSTIGVSISVKKIDGSANAVTVDGGGPNIDGHATLSLAVQYSSVTLWSNGINWWVF